MSFPALLSSISFSEVSGTLLMQTRISTFPSTNESTSLENMGRSHHTFLDFANPLFHCIRAFTNDLSVHKFRQVDDGHFSFHTCDLDRILDIHHAERAGRDDDTGSCFRRHPHSLHSHSLLFFWLVEQHQSTTTAAK